MSSSPKIQIFLENNEIESLTSLFTKIINNPDNIELECRFGYPKYTDNSFNPYISFNLFNKLRLSLDYNQSFKKNIENSTVSYFDNDLRIIKIEGNESPIYQQKRKLENIDIVYNNSDLIKDNMTSMLRFGLSYEMNIKNPHANPQLLFEKRRERISYKSDMFTIDLTVVNGQEYSVELEYDLKYFKNHEINNTFIKSILDPIKMVINNLYDINVIQSISKVYYQNFVNINNVGNIQPKNIKEDEVLQLLDGYSWTNKLNGLRYKMAILNISNKKNGIFLFGKNDLKLIVVENITENSILNKYLNTLLDTELMEYKNKNEIHAFDLYTFNKENLLEKLGHINRLFKIKQEFIKDINKILLSKNCSFELKKFFYTPNNSKTIYSDLLNVIRYMYNRYGTDIETYNDGIIATPKNDNNKPIFKWKFPNTVTIDFKLVVPESEEKNQENNIIAELHTYIKRNNIYHYFPFKYTPFTGNEKIATFTIPKENPNGLKNGQIVELKYNPDIDQFILVKIRTDKTYSNSQKVAIDTFVDMNSKFTLEKLSTLLISSLKVKFENFDPVKESVENIKKLVSNPDGIKANVPVPDSDLKDSLEKLEGLSKDYTDFHNLIKRYILNKWVFKNNIVLDLGAGKGGDIPKYRDLNIEHLFAVEPSKKMLQEDNNSFVNRLDNAYNDFKNKVTIINTKAENTKIIKKNINKQIDAIVSFFSLTFMFEDEKKVDQLVNTVDTFLGKNTKFIGVTMDGEAVFNKLNKKSDLKSNEYILEKKYKDEQYPNYGLEIKIHFNSRTVGSQTEWLVPFDLFTKKLKEKNIELVESSLLSNYKEISKDKLLTDTYNKLNASSNDLNSLYRYFVFSRKVELEQKYLTEDLTCFNSLNTILYKKETLGGGDCFYHALLQIIVPELYNNLSDFDKNEYMNRFRKILADKLTLETFLTLSNGDMLMKFPIIQNNTPTYYKDLIFIDLIKKFNNNNKVLDFLRDNKNKNNKDINEYAEYKELDKYIKAIIQSIDPDPSISKKIDDSLLTTKKKIMNVYKKSIENSRIWATDKHMEYIMRILGYNMFIIKNKYNYMDNVPERGLINYEDLYDDKKFSILIYNIDNTHYESIIDIKNKNEYYSMFSSDDNIIKEIKNYYQIKPKS